MNGKRKNTAFYQRHSACAGRHATERVGSGVEKGVRPLCAIFSVSLLLGHLLPIQQGSQSVLEGSWGMGWKWAGERRKSTEEGQTEELRRGGEAMRKAAFRSDSPE